MTNIGPRPSTSSLRFPFREGVGPDIGQPPMTDGRIAELRMPYPLLTT